MLNIFPRRPSTYIRNGGWVYPKHSSNIRAGSFSCRSNIFYIIYAQFSGVVKVVDPKPPFGSGVTDIISSRSQENMSGVNAFSIIASVAKDKRKFRQLSFKDHVRNAMRSLGLSFVPNKAVAIKAGLPLPFPTPRRGLFNLRHDALFQGKAIRQLMFFDRSSFPSGLIMRIAKEATNRWFSTFRANTTHYFLSLKLEQKYHHSLNEASL